MTNGRPEPLLSFGHRALVHFAVSNDLAAMTTKLEGEKTHFLPFNTGYDAGAGSSATAYLWERGWEKYTWLTIIGRLMLVETKEEWDVATGTSVRRTCMLFPRFRPVGGRSPASWLLSPRGCRAQRTSSSAGS